jgi:hypothetical protein
LELVGSAPPYSPPVTPESEKASDEEESLAKRGRHTAADRLVELALTSGAVLFHDQRSEPYVVFIHKERREIWPLRSQPAKLWLSHLAWTAERKAAASETIRTALSVLEAHARFEGEEHHLEVRVAWHERELWYDLGDWRAVRVAVAGWEVVDQPPLLFRHFGHQKVQAEPIRGGDLRSFLRLVNLFDFRQQLLLLVYLVVALVAHIPRPILIARGDHGSGKSTLFGFIRDLLDPSHLSRQSAPDSLREFVQAASHSLCLFLDNVSHLPDWMSDAFCRLCTGDGFSKRQLYTDDDDVVYAVRGLGGLNGINLIARRPDLLDRALILTLEAIPDANRKLDAEYRAEFERLRPSLMGALFDALAGTMATVDAIRLEALPRMADFARWGCAASRALGFAEQEFMDAFAANVREQNETALEDSVVAQAVLQLMRKVDSWEDTPAATLERLTAVAQDLHIDTRERRWPKSPSALTRRLNEIRPNLVREGITVQTGDRSGEARTIAFKSSENAVTCRHEKSQCRHRC